MPSICVILVWNMFYHLFDLWTRLHSLEQPFQNIRRALRLCLLPVFAAARPYPFLKFRQDPLFESLIENSF